MSDITLDRAWRLMLMDLGVDVATVAHRARIEPHRLMGESLRLTVPEYLRLIQAVDDEANDPLLAIRARQDSNALTFSPLFFAALCSSTLSVAFDRIALHKRLMAPMTVVSELTDRGLWVEWRWDDPQVRSPPLLAATEAVFGTQIARTGTRSHIQPLRVVTSAPLPDPAGFADFFGVAPEVGPHTGLLFSTDDATRPFLTASASIWETFEPALQRRHTKLEATAPVAERTQSVLLECLPGGEAELSQTARRLGMSGRTLQRRLRQEGTSFRTVVQSVRRKLAEHYLTQTHIPFAEIAFLLGFDELSSFSRAFRKWTGVPPSAVRTRANASG